jgi:hypothetical protein
MPADPTQMQRRKRCLSSARRAAEMNAATVLVHEFKQRAGECSRYCKHTESLPAAKTANALSPLFQISPPAVGRRCCDEDIVCGPFEILGRARDPNGDEWARWIRFKDADDRLHQVPIRDADLHGDPRTLASTLARQGLMVVTKHRAHLINYLKKSGCSHPIRTKRHPVMSGVQFNRQLVEIII